MSSTGTHTVATPFTVMPRLLRSLNRKRGGYPERRRAGTAAPGRARGRSVRVLAAGGGRRARLLGERGDREIAARGLLEDAGRLLARAGVELHEQVHDDLVLVVLVEAHVREELARPVVAEGRVRQGVGDLGPRAGLHGVRVDGDGAGGDPRRAGHHPLPAVLDRLDPRVVEGQVRLVVHAVQALHDGLLDLVDDLRPLARDGVDAVDALVVHLDLELLRPAAVAAQPGSDGR